MMGGQRSGALVFACWLLAGCELTPLAAESNALACRDGLENDGDRLRDCEDPDCWAYAHCRVSAPDAGVTPPPRLPPMIPDPPPGAVEPMPPTLDAGAPHVPDAQVELDGALDDAAVDAAWPPCEACPDGSCSDEGCGASAPLGRFRVVHLRVVVPVAKELAPLPVCFDDSSACGQFVTCCDPDPVVTMRVDGTKVGSLSAQDAFDTLWTEPGLEVELRNGSQIHIEITDDDAEDRIDPNGSDDPEPDLLFWCWTTVNAETVLQDIVCRPEDAPPPPTLTAQVGATLRLVRKPEAAP